VNAPTEVDQSSTRAARIFRFLRFTTATLAVLTFLLTFVALTPPSPYVTLLEISLVAWAILGIAWLPQLFSARFRSAWSNWSFWLYPALAFLAIVLASFEVPFRVTLLASRGAMNRAAHDVMTGKRDPAEIHWIGLYHVEFAMTDRSSFWFMVKDTGTDCSESNNSGFVYVRNRRRADATFIGSSLSHRSGNWYSWGSWCGGA